LSDLGQIDSCSISELEYDSTTSGGRNYSFIEISRMLSDVGFKNMEKDL
jgi:hypothetical protein